MSLRPLHFGYLESIPLLMRIPHSIQFDANLLYTPPPSPAGPISEVLVLVNRPSYGGQRIVVVIEPILFRRGGLISTMHSLDYCVFLTAMNVASECVHRACNKREMGAP